MDCPLTWLRVGLYNTQEADDSEREIGVWTVLTETDGFVTRQF